jgi:hypothetical protein
VVVPVSQVSESHNLTKSSASDLACRVLSAEPMHRQAVSDIYTRYHKQILFADCDTFGFMVIRWALRFLVLPFTDSMNCE